MSKFFIQYIAYKDSNEIDPRLFDTATEAAEIAQEDVDNGRNSYTEIIIWEVDETEVNPAMVLEGHGSKWEIKP